MAGSKKKKSKLNVGAGSFPDKPVKREESRDEDDDNDFLFDTKNEQLVLGQALTSPICLEAFAQHCTYEDFLIGNHRVIAFCILKAHADSVQITDDIFDVYRYDFPEDEKGTGGLGYIAKLRKAYTDNLTTRSYKIYLNKLKSDGVKYRIQSEYVKRLLQFARDPSATLDDLADVNAKIDQIISEGNGFEKRGFKTMEEINAEHDDEVKSRGKSGFGSTGFLFLNKHLTEGFAPGRISIVAGRPGMGKSTFVANSMIRLANSKNPVPNALFALEMDRISMIDRLNAIETDIPLKKLIQRDLTSEELRKEKRAKQRRAKKPIFIDDDVRLSLADVKREAKKIIEKHGVRVIFIDLFMKIKKPSGMYSKSTADQYTEMLNEAQVIARELGVHICLVVQIGRKAEMRNDKRPQISDLKDAGAYEEIADLILLFYREAYYVSKNVEEDFEADVVEINIGKQRQGTTGTVKALFVGSTTKIRKLNAEDEESFNKMIASMKPRDSGRKNKYDNGG